jgi:hypothetical protein
MTSSKTQPEAPNIAWEHDWETALRRARSERKLLLIDVEKDQ